MATKRARQAATVLAQGIITRAYADVGAPLDEDVVREIENGIIERVAAAKTAELTAEEERFAKGEALAMSRDFFRIAADERQARRLQKG